MIVSKLPLLRFFACVFIAVSGVSTVKAIERVFVAEGIIHSLTNDAVVYDNGDQAIAGGNIIVHMPKK